RRALFHAGSLLVHAPAEAHVGKQPRLVESMPALGAGQNEHDQDDGGDGDVHPHICAVHSTRSPPETARATDVNPAHGRRTRSARARARLRAGTGATIAIDPSRWPDVLWRSKPGVSAQRPSCATFETAPATPAAVQSSTRPCRIFIPNSVSWEAARRGPPPACCHNAPCVQTRAGGATVRLPGTLSAVPDAQASVGFGVRGRDWVY